MASFAAMARQMTLGVVLVLAAFGAGCQGDGKAPTTQESDDARVLCEREAATNEPPGVRGTLVGAFETTIKAVEPEIQREYDKLDRTPKLASQPEDDPLALCYYDVPIDQAQVTGIERVGMIVDQRLNSFLLYGGPKKEVPVHGIG